MNLISKIKRKLEKLESKAPDYPKEFKFTEDECYSKYESEVEFLEAKRKLIKIDNIKILICEQVFEDENEDDGVIIAYPKRFKKDYDYLVKSDIFNNDLLVDGFLAFMNETSSDSGVFNLVFKSNDKKECINIVKEIEKVIKKCTYISGKMSIFDIDKNADHYEISGEITDL